MGGQRFDEPTGVKQRFARVEQPQEDEEGQKIVQRADGADHNHEIADVRNIPAARFLNKGGIDVVGGDRDLRQVIEEVVQQNLHRKHRQKG